MSDMMRLFANMRNADDAEEKPAIANDVLAVRLRDSLAALQKKHEFTVGMIVRQKPLCPAYEWPGQLAIIVEVLSEPFINDQSPVGSQYYKERNDIKIGVIRARAGEFLVYHCDSARLEPAPPEDLVLLDK